MVNCIDCKFNSSCKMKTAIIKNCGKFRHKESQTTTNSTLKNTSYRYYKKKHHINKSHLNSKISDSEQKKRKNNLHKIAEKCMKNDPKKYNEHDYSQKNEIDLNKKRIMKDMEKGRGGPDVVGQKRMYGIEDSKIIRDAKKKLMK